MVELNSSKLAMHMEIFEYSLNTNIMQGKENILLSKLSDVSLNVKLLLLRACWSINIRH